VHSRTPSSLDRHREQELLLALANGGASVLGLEGLEWVGEKGEEAEGVARACSPWSETDERTAGGVSSKAAGSAQVETVHRWPSGDGEGRRTLGSTSQRCWWRRRRDAGWRRHTGEEGQRAGLEEVALYSHAGPGIHGAHAEAKDLRRRSHIMSLTDCSAGLGWAPAGSRLGRREWVGLRPGCKVGWAERKWAG
jgi:hypothetical protein